MRKMVFYILLFVSVFSFSQHKKNQPVYHEVNNKDVVQSVFPEAEKVEKENNYWFKITDKSGKIIGYAMSSAPYCKDVTGYNNVTPILIITDTKLVIKKVALLSNWETQSYITKLDKKGFFNLWNGKTVKEAGKVKIDGYTGATLTAKAVDKNVQFLVTKGAKNLPKKKK